MKFSSCFALSFFENIIMKIQEDITTKGDCCSNHNLENILRIDKKQTSTDDRINLFLDSCWNIMVIISEKLKNDLAVSILTI